MRTDVRFGQHCRKGATRAALADRAAVWEPSDEVRFRRRGRMLALADGSASVHAQALAAELALAAVHARFGSHSGAPLVVLADAFRHAHHVLRAHARAQADLRGMRAAMALALLRGDRLYAGAIGIAQVLRIRDARAELVACGTDGPRLGDEGELDLDLRTTDARARDVVALTSDGFSRHVGRDEIARAAGSIPDPARACRHLVESGIPADAPDDATIVMLRILRVVGTSSRGG